MLVFRYVLIALSGCICFWHSLDNDPSRPTSSPKIVTRLSRCDVRAKETLVLAEIEVIPARATAPVVTRIEHKVWRMRVNSIGGKNDVAVKPMIELEKIATDAAFRNLSANLRATHGFAMKHMADSEIGLEFNIMPQTPGVYIILPLWQFDGSDQMVPANPVMVIVR